MKLWHKMLIVGIGGAIVWVCSYLSSIYSDWAMVLSSANSVIVGVVALVTGFKHPE